MDHVPDVLTWRRRVWVWGPAVLQMAAIFVISGTPNLKEIPGGFSDLTGHLAGYALLGALVLRATAGARWAGVTAPAAALAWMFCAIYGISDEFHQSFVPGRTPSLADWLADAGGAAVAIAVFVLAARVIPRATRSAKGDGGPS